MKFLTGNPAFFLMPLLFCSCSEDTKKPLGNYKAVETSYTVVVNSKTIDSTKKSNAFYFQSDSSFINATSDSAAYLQAAVKYGRYVANWQMATFNKRAEPVSFKVFNQKNEDVLLKLNASQKSSIDSIAAILTGKEKGAVYDSSGNTRIINNNKAGLKNTHDTFIKAKPVNDKQKKAGGYTYVPI